MTDQPPVPPTAAPASPSDRDAMAAELALGLLDGADRAEALRLCLSDPDFAAAVEAWSLRLSPLLHSIPAAAPPSRVWDAVEARIGAARSASTVRHLRLWRGGALASGAVAASLAMFIALRPAQQPTPGPAPTTVAISQLSGTSGAATMAIAYDPGNGVLRLSPTSLDSATRSPELWVIPDDGVPRSLGIIRADGRELAVDAGLRRFLKEGVTLAITMEDPTTAPHKAPTSAPVLSGRITIL